MTTIEHTTKTSDPGPALRCLAWAVPSAVAGTLAVWVVARLGGVDLVVGSGDDARTVGWVSVALVSALAAAAGSLLLALLGRLPRGRAWWTAVATAVLLLSLGGPLGAATADAVVVLVAMHVVVWLALVTTAWRRC
jgi:Family of unknown function (DUF6069)